MPQGVHFESLGTSLARLPDVIRSIPDILRNPAANPVQAGILLAIALVLALILVLSVFLILMRPSAEERALLAEEEEGEWTEAAPIITIAEQAELDRNARKMRRLSSLTVSSVLILVTLAVWVVLGVTTSRPEVCASCHQRTSHTAAGNSDPHANVTCVDCHEGGGSVARVSVNVLTRAEHLVLATMNNSAASAYGKPVASDACMSCHRAQIAGTFYDARLKVKVVHSDPIAAGAECVDCHPLNGGVINATTVGMSPCLRCHDGKQAKAQCSTCHVGDPSNAITPSVALNQLANVQVPNPQCGGCHKDMTKCTACHGLTMPHTADFMLYGHARPGALDVWNNNLKVCSHCHYPGHNYCVRDGCHMQAFPAHPSPAWKTLHGLAPANGSQYNCACHRWNPNEHSGETFCQICHPNAAAPRTYVNVPATPATTPAKK